MRTIEILDRLIAFPTVSRDSNLSLIDFIRDVLASRGVPCELFISAEGNKANLYATVGPSDAPGVLLSGHTDVVPIDGQTWSSDPFRMRVSDGCAYGRGAADMKGFLACVISLVLRLDQTRLTTPLHLAFSYDEEIGCVGVRSLIEALRTRAIRPSFAIVGEPTNLQIATGHKGKLAARATCRGVDGHSSLAPKALNAIHLATDLVNEIRCRQDVIEADGKRDEAHEIPYSTIHVGRINGGTALNIVPNHCTIDFEIRNIGDDDASAILHRITEAVTTIISPHRARFPHAGIDIEIVNQYPGLETAPGSDVVRFVNALTESNRTFKVPFGTEGGLFSKELAIPTVVCGPGSMQQGHKADEFIHLSELERCDQMMDRLVAALSH